MDIATLFSGAVTGFGAIKDLTKLTLDAKIDASVRTAVIDAVDKLGQAQQTMYDLRDELSKLQEENATLKREADESAAFKARADKYELVKTTGGAVVWHFKEQPEHFACPNCMNQKRIEPLQDNRSMRGKYRCTANGCGAEFPINPQQRTDSTQYERGGAGDWMGR